MNYNIKTRDSLPDGTIDIVLQIEPKDQIIFCFILESWEGVFNYTTIDKKKHLLNLQISGDFETESEEVLDFLKKY